MRQYVRPTKLLEVEDQDLQLLPVCDREKKQMLDLEDRNSQRNPEVGLRLLGGLTRQRVLCGYGQQPVDRSGCRTEAILVPRNERELYRCCRNRS